MKTFILGLILIFCCNISFADTTKIAKVATTVQSLPDSTQLTMNKVYNDVKSGLQGLGSALKIGTEHVYPILIRQQIVNAITWLLIVISLSILSMYLIRACFKQREKANINYAKAHSIDESYEYYDLEEGSWLILLICGTIIGLGTVILFICNMNSIVTGFINPEYGAIKDIISFVK